MEGAEKERDPPDGAEKERPPPIDEADLAAPPMDPPEKDLPPAAPPAARPAAEKPPPLWAADETQGHEVRATMVDTRIAVASTFRWLRGEVCLRPNIRSA